MGLIYISEHKGFSWCFVSLLFQEKCKGRFILGCYREAPRVCLFKVDSFQEGEADLFSTKVGDS